MRNTTLKKHAKKYKLNDEEVEILKDFESRKASKDNAQIEVLQKIGQQALAETTEAKSPKKMYSIRLKVSVVDKIKKKAAEAGVPYQTYIGTLLELASR